MPNSTRTPYFDLKALNVFVTFTRSLNMSAAAKELGMTQSAVSQQIKALEKQINLPLVDREVRPVKLTSHGDLLLNRAKRMLEEADETIALLHRCSGRKLPSLSIGLTSSFAEFCLPHLVNYTSQLAEDIKIKSSLSDELASLFSDRRIDLIFCSEPLPGDFNAEEYLVLREPLVAVYPPKIKKCNELQNDQNSFKILAEKFPYISLPKNLYLTRYIERYLHLFLADSEKFSNNMEVSSPSGVVAMVEAGLGWTITTPLTLLIAKHHGALTNAQVRPLPEPMIDRSIYLYAHRNELGEIPAQMAKLAAKIFREYCLSDMEKLAPQVKDKIYIA